MDREGTMNKRDLVSAACALILILLPISYTHAALLDRGCGLIYDDVLDVT